MVSEKLQNRINRFMGATKDLAPNISDIVGQSKGAISDREMDAFGRSATKSLDDELKARGMFDPSLSTQMKINRLNMDMLRDRLLGSGFSEPRISEPRLEDGSPIPEGFRIGPLRTLDFRDSNQNGIEDRAEGIYRPRDLVPESGLFPRVNENVRKLPERLIPRMPLPKRLLPESLLPDMPMDKTDQQDEELEDQQRLQRLIDKATLQESAEGQMAQQIAMLGEGDDSELAHLRPGEVVLPPEFFDDPDFEQQVEQKFRENNIDPEEAIVGGGIASLNPRTGLEQFGFFKKVGKRLKKFAKKIAPVAGPLANFIPGVGPVLAGAIGAGTNLVAGKGIKGAAMGALSGYGSGKVLANVAKVGGLSGAQFADAQFADKLRALRGGFKEGGLRSLFGGGQQTQQVQGAIGGSPILTNNQPSFDVASANLDSNTGMFVDQFGNSVDAATYQQYIADPSSIPSMVSNQQQGQGFFRGRILDDLLGFDPGGPGSGKGIYGVFPGMGQGQGQGQGEGGGGGFLGGLGDALKLGGIGALAAGLGKLAYEDAKKQQGVALTPLTTMSPTGRYNIEAEIARRMGQPAPNPVEFGLLPEGTLPELSGGKPRAMAYGGSVYGNGIEDLEGGMARGMMMGGPVMAYAKGGAVLMQEGGEMDVESFPRKDGPINGPGTEKSDDIPAMLSDGEFVMTGQAVRGAGSFDINNNNGILSLTPSMEEDRERGMKNMYQMMDFFESNAQPSS